MYQEIKWEEVINMYLTIGELISELSKLNEESQVLIPALDGFLSGDIKISEREELVILEGNTDSSN